MKKQNKEINNNMTLEQMEAELKNLQDKITVGKIAIEGKESGLPWIVREVPISQLYIPEFQREVKPENLNRIIKEFDYKRVDVKAVSYHKDEDLFVLMDGNHTRLALIHEGYETMTCKVYFDLTPAEEALLFADQDRNKVRVSKADKFRAYLYAGAEPAVTIKRVMDEFGLVIGKPGQYKTCTSVRKLEQIANKYGEEGLRFCFQVIKDANWENDFRAYNESALNIGFNSYEICCTGTPKVMEAKYADLIRKLRKFKTSTEFIDVARANYQLIGSKHPEQLVGRYIKEVVLK